MAINLIAAMDEGRVIGQAGALPWHLPDEMRMFKRITTGHPCIMGRKTWESLKKPLADRLNVVVTRQPDYAAVGAIVTGSLQAALAACAARRDEWGDEVFVVGGADLYALAMPVADRLYLTKVRAWHDGDTHFPVFDEARFSARRTGGGDGPPAYETWVFERRD